MYLQFHSVKDPSKNYDIWVRVLFGSLQDKVQFGLLHIFHFLTGLVFDRTWVLVQFVLAGFRFFPISNVQ